jgi:RND family efflux transporter MFP subunit
MLRRSDQGGEAHEDVMRKPRLLLLLIPLLLATGCGSNRPAGNEKGAFSATATVSEQMLPGTVRLQGELQPYQAVSIQSRLDGTVEWVGVMQGTHVRPGAPLCRLSAQDLTSQKEDAESKLAEIRTQRAEANARMVTLEQTWRHLQGTAARFGTISTADLDVAAKNAEAARVRLLALEQSETAAQAAIQSIEEKKQDLVITAPFEGMITARNVAPGTQVGPTTPPLLRLEQLSKLRLVVAVPQISVAGVATGSRIGFTVPVFPGQTFQATVRRIAPSPEADTQTMSVELEVNNSPERLATDMLPEITWPIARSRPSLLVPASAIMSTPGRAFVIRVRDGKAEWVTVKRGVPEGDLAEVLGDLRQGDIVLRSASEQIQPGTPISVK